MRPRPTQPRLTHATLIALLHYDPATGKFVWRHRPNERPQWNARYAGKEAGFNWSPNGKSTYRSIRIFDWPFLGHRLAAFYMTGCWPINDVDHRDGDGLNNRWDNLRPATKAQNGANRGANKNSKTGLKGVSVDRRTGRYRATIQAGGRWMQLGSFSTSQEAHAAYAAAAQFYHQEFARIE